MKPPEFKFDDLAGFVALASRFPSFSWVFRGQADGSLPLRPKAGRPEFYLGARATWEARENTSVDQVWQAKGQDPFYVCFELRHQRSDDLMRFHAWRKNAAAFCPSLPDDDYECLAFAQHYGLATRLLDWSANPLVALFFAVEEEDSHDVDGAVFCYSAKYLITPGLFKLGESPGVGLYNPRPFERRILAQSGLFTYHSEPDKALGLEPLADQGLQEASRVNVNLAVIRVGADQKAKLQRSLNGIGVITPVSKH